jgi:uncharacterized protein (DUF302 family)
MNFDVPYGITRRIPSTTLAAARERVTAALKEEGFGVLTEIDVQATLAKKLDVQMDPYVILGACNPKLAHQALTKEPAIGLLLPCNVVLAQEGKDVVVSAASPRAMFAVVGDAAARGIASIADEAESSLRRALDRLQPASSHAAEPKA